jgi:hypothetical protein
MESESDENTIHDKQYQVEEEEYKANDVQPPGLERDCMKSC